MNAVEVSQRIEQSYGVTIDPRWINRTYTKEIVSKILEDDLHLVVKGYQEYQQKQAKKRGESAGVVTLTKGEVAVNPSFIQSKPVVFEKPAIDIVGGMYEYFPLTSAEDCLANPLEDTERQFVGVRGQEYVYSDALAMKLGGKREVSTPAGFIDVLTESQLIEVKAVVCWKHAVGQVLMYGLYYPLHQKRIHLFGSCDPEKLNSISKWVGQAGVVLTHEP